MNKRVVYVAPDGETYIFNTPDAKNRLEAVAMFMDVCEKAGDNPRQYRVLRVEGFAPSKAEIEIREHQERFGGE